MPLTVEKITNAEVSLVISNNPKAYALERAKNHNIEAVCISQNSLRTEKNFWGTSCEAERSGVESLSFWRDFL